MGDYARDGLDLDDDDRLPWLEPADNDSEGEGLSLFKLLVFIFSGLVIVGALVFGIWYLKDRQAQSDQGEGTLIAAPKGDYKIPAKEADAKAFQGEGDATYPVSEGVDRDGHIDPSRLPEVPVTGGMAPVDSTKTALRRGSRVSEPVGAATPSTAVKVVPTAGVLGGGAMIQLGAYGSEAVAKEAWNKLSKRFAYLTPLGTSIERATVGNTIYYRLRASASGATEANLLCGKLKVAGENCIVVR